MSLHATGMAWDSATFQARSALMGVGFTTNESEDVMHHPVGRRVMLYRSLTLTAGVALMAVAAHTGPLALGLDRLTRWGLSRFADVDTRDFAALLQFDPDYSVTEIHVRDDQWLIGRPPSELHLTSQGVIVLGINRTQGLYPGAPKGDTVIQDGDEVLTYGQAGHISELATRPKGDDGNKAHGEAVDAHQKVLRRQELDSGD